MNDPISLALSTIEEATLLIHLGHYCVIKYRLVCVFYMQYCFILQAWACFFPFYRREITNMGRLRGFANSRHPDSLA